MGRRNLVNYDLLILAQNGMFTRLFGRVAEVHTMKLGAIFLSSGSRQMTRW